MLKTPTLFGERDKVDLAILRLREYEPPEGYYLAFSGGKDSIVIHHLAEVAGVKFEAWYNHTTIDHPRLIQFMRREYPGVRVQWPEMSMWKLIAKTGFPPTSRVRYCCAVLKETGGKGRFVITGVRRAEGVKRSRRGIVEFCQRDGTKKILNPIIDWLCEDVWEYIRDNKLKYCSLYDEGYTRLGCIMCPVSRKTMLEDAKKYPKYYQAYLRAFEKMLKNRPERNHESGSWKTGQDVMDWWVSLENERGESEGQPVLFG